jgi:hypothetical protein
LRRKEQGAAVSGHDDSGSGNGVDIQQRQARGQATVAEAEAAQGQTTINQQAVAIAAETVRVAARRQRQPWQWQRQWRRQQWRRQRGSHGSGDGGANMAPTVAEGAADVDEGVGHLSEYHTHYYLHNSTYRCDNNCQAHGKTQKCFDSKHFYVLIGKTHLCFAKHICVFNLWGLFVEYTFGRTLFFLKNEIGFSNIGDLKKIWNRVKTIF